MNNNLEKLKETIRTQLYDIESYKQFKQNGDWRVSSKVMMSNATEIDFVFKFYTIEGIVDYSKKVSAEFNQTLLEQLQ